MVDRARIRRPPAAIVADVLPRTAVRPELAAGSRRLATHLLVGGVLFLNALVAVELGGWRGARRLITAQLVVPPLPADEHFLEYKNCQLTGINHQLSNVQALLSEAALLRRTAIVRGPCLHPLHNNGVELATTRWSDYRDLDGAVVWARRRISTDVAADAPERHAQRWSPWSWAQPLDGGPIEAEEDADVVDGGGALAVAATRVPWISGERFDRGDVGRASKHNTRVVISSTIITEEEMHSATRPRFIQRYMGNARGGLWSSSWQLASSEYEFKVELPPSAEVARAAALIKASLRGWSRDGSYAALHIRRGDRLKQTKYKAGNRGCPYGGDLARDTSPAAVAEFVAELIGTKDQGAKSSTVLYVMSDERATAYWDELSALFDACCAVVLKRDIDVLADDPASASFLAELRLEDNYKLYEAEKVVFDGASLRVYTFANQKLWPKAPSLSRCEGHS